MPAPKPDRKAYHGLTTCLDAEEHVSCMHTSIHFRKRVPRAHILCCGTRFRERALGVCVCVCERERERERERESVCVV